jgi:hypothetical protein
MIKKVSVKHRENARFKDTEHKLAANRVSLEHVCSEVKAGQDDRWSKLHEGYFYPGAGCSAMKIMAYSAGTDWSGWAVGHQHLRHGRSGPSGLHQGEKLV